MSAIRKVNPWKLKNGTKEFLKKIPGLARLWWIYRILTRQTHRDLLLQALPKQSVGAEIGVHRGDFSKKILAVARPKKFFLIDPWIYEDGKEYTDSVHGSKKGHNQTLMDRRYESVLKRFSKNIGVDQVCVIRDTSENALQEMENHSLDWVYIDGNHLYEFVKKDLELSFSKVRPGGVIAGDDYFSGGWFYGQVKQAVDDFADENNEISLHIIGNQFWISRHDRGTI